MNEHVKKLTTEMLGWFHAADTNGRSDEIYEEIVSIIEKNEADGCEGCKYDGKTSSEAETRCTSCCNNYYNKWTPKKTRQTEFLKMFPNAKVHERGFVDVLPCQLEKSMKTVNEDDICTGVYKMGCLNCRTAYWNEEVE